MASFAALVASIPYAAISPVVVVEIPTIKSLTGSGLAAGALADGDGAELPGADGDGAPDAEGDDDVSGVVVPEHAERLARSAMSKKIAISFFIISS